MNRISYPLDDLAIIIAVAGLELTGAEANGFTDRTATSYGLPILE